ncbi:hypothetical protein POX_a01735 [Penicillium oxalicum]|uniref:Uncharacterized protein n=1 Tax=Penicillium oxalicum (strain 114-2 / CGMCC 5302) TaxID=933388 RepID=S8BE10_PENO1|nr:hypothetical protein POX_a01735 [Penicillium oxalicum]EPS33277.1 hypothetical protein PDE_08239 [Penicillium oxalicum 114-2]KAI2795130.1 hypothetical protein POX_a01735 [Penicillium oxalicum]
MDPPRQFTSNLSWSSPSEASSEDNLALLAEDVEKESFITSQTQDQYLVFTSAPPAQSFRLSDDDLPESRFFRFFFNAETEALIASVIPFPRTQTCSQII